MDGFRIHLMELSPAPFRTFVVGTAFQLGNLASSASPTIEAKVGLNFPLPPTVVDGEITSRYEYGKVMFIFMGCVSVPFAHHNSELLTLQY